MNGLCTQLFKFAVVSKTYPILDVIQDPSDLRALQPEQLPQLCSELRAFIIDSVLAHGGHFAANLGVVELTVALHYVFNTPDDPLIWDVGHQAYGHKILTGRKNIFHTNRKWGGISGFPSRSESEYDAFGTGHSSTAISAALGMAMASGMDGNTGRTHIAVVGDGAFTAGQAFEGLNNLAPSASNTLVILNDNNIGIDVHTGAINKHFNRINPGDNLFTHLGLDYHGPFDGHDVMHLVSVLEQLKHNRHPRILHVHTVKGKGHPDAEKEQTKWHSTSRYVKIEQESKANAEIPKYQDVFGTTLLELADTHPKVCGVTPAMPTGSGMIKAMIAHPDRFFDVGIAEQHAVTFASGLASRGYTVFCSLYSTFLQRAYDQVVHDACLQNLKVIFCIDRAGNVGDDGPTHHGLFDLPMFLPLPNVTVLAPSSGVQLRQMLHYCAKHAKGPVAIRYPKGLIYGPEPAWNEEAYLQEPTPECVQEGSEIVLLSVGSMLQQAKSALGLLAEEGIYPALYDMKILKPFGSGNLISKLQNYKVLISVEDGSLYGGFGNWLQAAVQNTENFPPIVAMGFPDKVISHGTSAELLAHYELDAAGISKAVMKAMKGLR